MSEDPPSSLPVIRQKEMDFHAESVRAGLFACALDIMGTMKEAAVPDAEAALITGATEFAVQLFMQVALQAGVTRQDSLRSLLKAARFYARKHGTIKSN